MADNEYYINNDMSIDGKKLSSGFTLIEVLIAIAVVGIGCLAALIMQTSAMHGNLQADNLTVASFLAESEIERLKSLSFPDVSHEVTTNAQPVVLELNRSGKEYNAADGQKYIRTVSYYPKTPTTFSHQIKVRVDWTDMHGSHSISYNFAVTNFSFS